MDYILTDGKNYVMENPTKVGEYLLTTSPLFAKKFSYKQVKGLTQRKGKKYTKFRNFQLLNCETGDEEKINSNYKGNAGVYIGDKGITINHQMLDDILREVDTMLGLAGWSDIQLDTFKNELNKYLSYYDSAESDLEHALQKYKMDHNGKKAQAHKMAKFGYLLDNIRYERSRVKQCMRYVDVFKDAHTYKYTIEKLKLELSKTENREYKGRTDYWQAAIDILYK